MSNAQACAHCGNTKGKLFNCSRCRSVGYCNAECQRAHWHTHKQVCPAPHKQVCPASQIVICSREGCCEKATASCSLCGWKSYCGPDCQKQDWRGGHRRTCDRRALNATRDIPSRLAIMTTTMQLHTQSCSQAGCGAQIQALTAFLCSTCRNCYCTGACRDADAAHDCAACMQPNREASVLWALVEGQNSVVQVCDRGCDSARLDPMLTCLGISPVVLVSPCDHAAGGGFSEQAVMDRASETCREVQAANKDTLLAYLTQLERLMQVTSTGRTQTRIPTTYKFLEETWAACHILMSHIVGVQGVQPPQAVVDQCAEQLATLLRYGEGLLVYFKSRPGETRGTIPLDDLCLAFRVMHEILLGYGG